MTKVAILLADGFETVEALTVADVLRRAGIKTALVSVMGTTHVMTGQQVQVIADTTVDAFDATDTSCYVVPGGMPAVKRLLANNRVRDMLVRALDDSETIVAASCAGPVALAELGLLAGRRITAFPGCRELFPHGALVDESVVTDGNLITARSTSCSVEFALTLAERLAGTDVTRKVIAGLGGER